MTSAPSASAVPERARDAVETVDLTQRELEDLRDGYSVDTLAGVLSARDVDADLSDTTARSVRLRSVGR